MKHIRRYTACLLSIALFAALLPARSLALPEEASPAPEEIIEDMETLLLLKGIYSWSELTEGEQALVLSEYDTTSYILEKTETAGLPLTRSLNCILMLKITNMTPEEVLLADSAYEHIWLVVVELNRLDRLAREVRLTDEQYNELRLGILNGSTLEALWEEPEAEEDDEEFSILSDPTPPEEPTVDLSYVAPYGVKMGENESVSLNTGSLTLQYPLVNIPGVNGLDIDLSVRYDSSDAALYAMGTNTSYENVQMYAHKYILRGYYDYTTPGGSTTQHREPSRDVVDELFFDSWGDAWNSYDRYQNSIWSERPRRDLLGKYVEVNGMSRTNYREYTAGGILVNSNGWEPPTSVVAPATVWYDSGGYVGTLSRISGSIQTPINIRENLPNGNYRIHHTRHTAVYGGNVYGWDTTVYYQKAEPEMYPDIGYPNLPNLVGPVKIYTYSFLSSYSSTVKSPTYGERTGNIGAGWSFALPSYDTSDRVLHLGNGASYPLNDNNNSFKDHTLQDMVFSAAASFVSGTLTSAYKLRFDDGTTYWFAGTGCCIGKSDRFNNNIYYGYTTGSDDYRLSQITDDAGRETNISYTATAVTITMPDGKETVLTLDQPTQAGGRHIL